MCLIRTIFTVLSGRLIGKQKTTEENEEQANKDIGTERTQELKARQMKDPNKEQEKGRIKFV